MNIILLVASTLATIATLAMAVATFKSVKEAKTANLIAHKTFNEMVCQRELSDRAYVVVTFNEDYRRGEMYFDITNYGKRIATNVSISVDNDFFDIIRDDDSEGKLTEHRVAALRRFLDSKFILAPNQSRQIVFTRLGGAIITSDKNFTLKWSYAWEKADKSPEGEHHTLEIKFVNYHWLSGSTAKEPIVRIADSLEKIERDLKK